MLRTALGPTISGYLEDPSIVEVMLNPDGRLWIDRLSGGLEDTGCRVMPEDAERIVRLVAHHVGVEVHAGSPRVSAELPESGERFEGLVPPVVAAPCFAIRRPAVAVFTLGDYVDAGIMSANHADLLRVAVRERKNVLVAGGTGLAPIKAMIRDALENGAYEGHLTLYQGARTREWLYDVDDFRRLEEAYPDRFTYRPCLSEEEADGFAAGLVTEVLAADHESLHGHVGYVCGPPPMVEAALKTLMRKRLFPRDIYREDFFNNSDKTASVRSPLIRR